MTVETKAMIKKRQMKRAARVALIGAVLALVCRMLPPEYHGPCETIVHICTGGL